MAQATNNTTVKNCAWMGALLSIVGNISWQDIMRTVILGIIGTIVSFTVSALLKKIRNRP